LQNVIDNAHNYTWPGIVSTLHYAQQGLRDAANTIWELRNKLAGTVDQQDEIERLEDENARLRSCLSDDAENARQIMAENAKLRELCGDMRQFTGAACKKYPRLFDPSAQGGQMVQLNAIDAFEQRMAELGIEVGDE
jgi:predicted nuclease with TOPRIM domain